MKAQKATISSSCLEAVEEFFVKTTREIPFYIIHNDRILECERWNLREEPTENETFHWERDPEIVGDESEWQLTKAGLDSLNELVSKLYVPNYWTLVDFGSVYRGSDLLIFKSEDAMKMYLKMHPHEHSYCFDPNGAKRLIQVSIQVGLENEK